MMIRNSVRLLAVSAWLSVAAFAKTPCESLTALQLPDTVISSAKAMPAGIFQPPAGQAISELPAFCEVHGLIQPTPKSAIHFEVWLPQEGWNGRLETVGNGGLAGSISYGPMGAALRRGFATASTDTGHTTKEPATWLRDREKLIDYSYRGLHMTTVNAKSIIDAFYGQAPKYAYYMGCSLGGKQGLIEAQRFPADYDGIVAGDAANFWLGQMMSEVWNGVVTGTPETTLPQEKLKLIEEAVLAACDDKDGVSDGLISDPRRCHFDPQTLVCKGDDTSHCLTAAQAAAVAKLYGGPTNPRTGEKLYPGFYPGGELGWGKAGGQPVINRGKTSGVSSYDFWRYAFYDNPEWDFRSFDFDRDPKVADDKLALVMNATNADLSAFQKLGHKLIYYHGTSDPLVPAQHGVEYYEDVARKSGGQDKAQSFYRVFLVPGLYHCAGGPGPSAIGANYALPAPQQDPEHDVISALTQWVEKGTAPVKIVATKYVDNSPAKGIAMQRPLCVYPQAARYKGTGDANDAANFVCTAP